MRPFRFNVFVDELPSRTEWQRLARRVEELGFSTLLVGDHLGLASALASLVSAADATTRLRVGTRVLNSEFFHPLRLAQEAATVDVLTDGRLELGLGSGWSHAEYGLLGLEYRPAAVRARRLAATIDTIQRAWAGATPGDADCHTSTGPQPVQRPHPPLMVGGHSDAVLAVAARHADIVGLTGATVVRGDYRPTAVSYHEVARRVAFVRDAAGPRFAHLELGLKVIVVVIDGDAVAAAGRLAAASGIAPDIVLGSPFAFVGSPGQLADKLYGIREDLGLSTFDVPAWAVDDVAPVVARMVG